MKKTLALLAAPVILLGASTNVTAVNKWGFTPYVGADAAWRHLNLQNGLGDNVFPHDFPEGNVYAGIKVSDYIAVEGGYEATRRKSRTVTLHTGDVYLTTVIPSIATETSTDSVQFVSSSQIKGPHINLVATLPLSDKYRLQLLALVGVASLKATYYSTMANVNGSPYLEGVYIVTNHRLIKKKSVLRLGGGLQHMLADNWGVRVLFKWENTHRISSPGVKSDRVRMGDKNSLIYSFGAVYNF